jgi:hypothetical protein
MTERVLGEKGSKRRKRFLLLPILATAALALFWVAGAQAVHDVGVFELEGNATNGLVGDPAGDDWDNVCRQADGGSLAICGTNTVTAASGGATAVSWLSEPDRSASIFTGGGSKDPQDLTEWLWKNAGGLPDKDNLRHAFAARYTCDTSATIPCTGTDGDQYLYFGSDRFDNSGDAQQGFWFFQNPVCADGSSSQGGTTFTDCAGGPPAHKAGDLLILSDFSIGGTVSTINVYQWVDSGGDTSTHLDFIDGGTNAKCDPALVADPFCGIVNAGTITMPWSFTDKSKTPGNGALNGEFYEAGINLTNLGLEGECFASFESETRSAVSPTATLKDFVLGGFGQCKAGIESTQTWTPEDSATVDVTGATVWTGTVTFTLYPTSDCTGTAVYTSSAVNVSNADATASTDDASSQPSAIGAAGNGTYSWAIHFDALTPAQLDDQDSCVETTSLTITDS